MSIHLSYWNGKLVKLRAVESTDWETYKRWSEDEELMRNFEMIPFPQSEEQMREWAEKRAKGDYGPVGGDNFRFSIEDHAQHLVGTIFSHHVDRRVGHFYYGILIDKAHQRKGYASEAIQLLLQYFFKELRYQKATVTLFSFNEATIKLHEKLGFKNEGKIRSSVFTHGTYYDELIYGMTKDEFDKSSIKSR